MGHWGGGRVRIQECFRLKPPLAFSCPSGDGGGPHLKPWEAFMGLQGGVFMTRHQQPPAHPADPTDGFLGPWWEQQVPCYPSPPAFMGLGEGQQGGLPTPKAFSGLGGGSGVPALLPKHTNIRTLPWHYSPPQRAPLQARILSWHAARRVGGVLSANSETLQSTPGASYSISKQTHTIQEYFCSCSPPEKQEVWCTGEKRKDWGKHHELGCTNHKKRTCAIRLPFARKTGTSVQIQSGRF